MVYVYTSTVAMLFKLNPTTGQALYLQLMQQIRHAIENGALKRGDQLPGIRTLAETLVVSPTTVTKAYVELEHEGLLELRQGSGAFISGSRRPASKVQRIHEATQQVRKLVDDLRKLDLSEDEIRRVFEAELLHSPEAVGKR
jgi:GntR family transcriptional regulator